MSTDTLSPETRALLPATSLASYDAFVADDGSPEKHRQWLTAWVADVKALSARFGPSPKWDDIVRDAEALLAAA